MAGSIHSSPRAELAAIMLAAAGPGPAHIVTGSLVNVNRYRRRLRLLNDPWLRPSKLHKWKNGDFWQAFLAMLRVKGIHAVALEWVPSHTTVQDMIGGKITAERRAGNATADSLAADAINTLAPSGPAALRFLATRRRDYVNFVQAVQRTQLRS